MIALLYTNPSRIYQKYEQTFLSSLRKLNAEPIQIDHIYATIRITHLGDGERE